VGRQGFRCRSSGAELTERVIGNAFSHADVMNEKQFRFQDLEIWTRAAQFSPELFQLADQLDKRRLFRFAEQLRAATLSITNNIAEGSGSLSDIDFANFLNTARRSTFEVANILFLLGNNGYLPAIDLSTIVGNLEQESRMLLAFIRTLKSATGKRRPHVS
jgi:four helix bundle protein